MNESEIKEKLAEQEKEEKAKTTFSKLQLEQVVSQFALALIKANNLKLNPQSFKFLLEEYQVNAAFMKAGNPVEIHISLKELSDALVKKGAHLIEFKRLIESSLLAVPKLLPSLSVIPARDIAKWNEELRKYKWHVGDDTSFLPKLLPDSEIFYDIQLNITATHIKSDVSVVVESRNLDLTKLRRFAREQLSEEYFNGKKENENETTNSSEIQSRTENDIRLEGQNYSG